MSAPAAYSRLLLARFLASPRAARVVNAALGARLSPRALPDVTALGRGDVLPEPSPEVARSSVIDSSSFDSPPRVRQNTEGLRLSLWNRWTVTDSAPDAQAYTRHLFVSSYSIQKNQIVTKHPFPQLCALRAEERNKKAQDGLNTYLRHASNELMIRGVESTEFYGEELHELQQKEFKIFHDILFRDILGLPGFLGSLLPGDCITYSKAIELVSIVTDPLGDGFNYEFEHNETIKIGEKTLAGDRIFNLICYLLNDMKDHKTMYLTVDNLKAIAKAYVNECKQLSFIRNSDFCELYQKFCAGMMMFECGIFTGLTKNPIINRDGFVRSCLPEVLFDIDRICRGNCTSSLNVNRVRIVSYEHFFIAQRAYSLFLENNPPCISEIPVIIEQRLSNSFGRKWFNMDMTDFVALHNAIIEGYSGRSKNFWDYALGNVDRALFSGIYDELSSPTGPSFPIYYGNILDLPKWPIDCDMIKADILNGTMAPKNDNPICCCECYPIEKYIRTSYGLYAGEEGLTAVVSEGESVSKNNEDKHLD